MNAAGDWGLRPTIARLGAPGIAAAIAIVAAAGAVALMLPGLASAVFTPTPNPEVVAPDAAQDQAARMENFRKQIDGRTMFFVPAKPAPPAVEAAHEDGHRPAPPSAPTTYGGPAPIAMIFGTVWFADGAKLKAGDEATGDVQVVRLEAPWAAVLKWKGVEFTVKMFDRDSVVLKAPGQQMTEGTPPEPKPVPPPEAAPAAPGTAPSPPPAAGDSPPPADQTSQPPGQPAGPENNS